MPLAFPSHQGLLAPFWRAWPHRFGVLALWSGAAAPDVVDGIASPLVRGHLGQWVGHSIVGLFTLCIAVGLSVLWLLRGLARRAASTTGDGGMRAFLRSVGAWLCRVDSAPSQSGTARLARELSSVWIGAASHVFFDVISHEHSHLLWPWAEDPVWLGRWWTTAWIHVSPPGYADYSIGPHFVAWLVLSLAGIVMFVRWPPITKA